ncbi:QcrA and Rieske domain-containing protein [Mucilaginibacter paludis]|uniref:Rieske (2Fe-2S) iron-sulfur domain-containing protein n=1 Tax=Mucilaginibacter paludis DSM 18603 TaxID=714943 RepID=H1YG90_9SPHI|nr:Rieske 2Fe-2S domain-containing protein [Mucilaginibacter paludis]EHQ27354.1 Rieske (2Fe-2S) iron-sulfur domain-containing protein [Mucilaginibacter paludis DSM 18603]
MERNEFLSKLGIGLVAVCAGCALSSCGSGAKNNDPSPQNNPPATGSGAIFTANLGTELLTVGQSKTSNGIILVRTATGNATSSFTAVQVACTHQGTAINYNTAQGIFICPNHGSEFSTSGSVLLGPAVQSLQKYTISIAGNTLTVSA